MEIEFTLSRKEYEEFVCAAYAKIARIGKINTKMFVANIIAWIFVGAGFTGVLRFYETANIQSFKDLTIGLALLLIGALAVFAVSIFKNKLYLHHSIGKNGRMLRPQKVQLSENGIKFSTSDCEQMYSWNVIQKQQKTKNLVCLYIDNNQALLIPMRSLKEQNISEEFLAYLSDRIGSNQANSAAAKKWCG